MANIFTNLNLTADNNFYITQKINSIGYVGENTVTRLNIEVPEITQGATYELETENSAGVKNVVLLSVNAENSILYLDFTANMLTVNDLIMLQLRVTYADNSIKKSNRFAMKIAKSISATDYYEEYAVTVFDQLVAQCQTIIDGAEGYVERAETAAENAEDYSESASASATAASNSADNAATSETNASNSANAASTSAGNAHTSEVNAANSADNAATSAGNASTSETNAHNYELSAKGYSESASTSAGNASTSETNARNSATAAHDSEVNAASSENNASTYATNAYNSAQNAATSETNASASAQNAATSETNAASSATSAATSASNASTSETNAANSATSAATSAVNAHNSEVNASTSETNASASATEAAASAATVSESANQINSNTKRIENLEAINKGITYVENVQSGTANTMTVSANNIGAYGALNYVGGASKVVKNLFFKVIPNSNITSSGTFETFSDTFNAVAKITAGETYTFNNNGTLTVTAGFYTEEPTMESTTYNNARLYIGATTNYTFTAPSGVSYIAVRYSNDFTSYMLNEGSTLMPYVEPNTGEILNAPVTSITSRTDTFSIPNEVQALNGYGLGVDSTYYNYIDFVAMKYKKNVGIVDISTLAVVYNNGLWTAGITELNLKLPATNENVVNAISTNYTAYKAANSPVPSTVNSFCVNSAGTIFFNTGSSDIRPSGMLVFALNTNGQTETDISSYFADNFIKVSASDTITFVNEHNLAVPYSLTTNDSVS